jgi:iron complex transport system substrate-binding protein
VEIQLRHQRHSCRQRLAGTATGLWMASLGLAAAAQADAAPRVVSFNICADQLVVALADPAQIAGLSPYAADPAFSVVAEAARAYPRLAFQAEALVALAPDLVLVGPVDRPATRRMLTAAGLRVHETGLVTDLAAARVQIREVAALLGRAERGETLVAALDAAQRRLAALHPPARRVLVLERGGYAAGPQSLAGALVAAAGWRIADGAPAGLGGFISLERVIALGPDLLVLVDPPSQAADQGALLLTHPALRNLYPPERRIALPSRFTLCGGPAFVAALDYLADALARWMAGP